MARSALVDARVAQLVDGFGRYVRAYDDHVSFTGEQLAAHRATVALRRQAGSVRAAVGSEQFLVSLRRTLLAWGIGRRASRLVPADAFAAALHAALPRLEPLESLTIDGSELPGDLAGTLAQLISSLGVVENKAKLVAGTKTLHHLLPDLVPPMDRAWTGLFFQFHLPEWQDARAQRRIFELAYGHFAGVARQVRPQRYVTGAGWRTTRSKIIDNALIGFCMTELGEPQPVEEAANQVSFDVPGFPPAKNEALSMLGAGHSHAPRVRLLLEQAQQAAATQGFTPVGVSPVGLDVVLYAPDGSNPGDATNYLGGIADVLENKAHRGTLDHLGGLANVWLYRNDLQIKAVSYHETEADSVSYTVTIRELDPQSPAERRCRLRSQADQRSVVCGRRPDHPVRRAEATSRECIRERSARPSAARGQPEDPRTRPHCRIRPL